MSLLSGYAPSTSAGGSLGAPRFCWVVVAGAMTLPGTASALPPADLASQARTTNGVEAGVLRSAEAAVSELRRLTGFTWDQLARLFSVSRRTVHFWASGKVMNAANEEHLHRVLALVRLVDRGSSSENRVALLQPEAGGELPIDLLSSGRYSDAIAALGAGRGRAFERARAPLGVTPEPMQKVPSPASLMDARHDRVHTDVGTSRAPKIGRVRKS